MCRQQHKHCLLHYRRSGSSTWRAFSKSDKMSVTVDIWTNRVMHSFLGVTVHFIEDWLKRGLLACIEFNRGSYK